MQSFMNITVRVMTAKALAELKAVEGELATLNRQLASGSVQSTRFGQATGMAGKGLGKFGSQLQWTGRQLQYNFTLPLALAAGAATKFALDNEQAMTRVKKVYGDASLSASTLKNETKALEGAFVALSNRYGVAQKEVINIAGAWAAAGASGVALAKVTEQTMRTMVLGELSAVDATQALISIQAQYGLSTKELSDTINQLNIIENQTAISMGDLVQGFSRAAGVARDASIDTAHLAAMLASLVPSAGSAAQAGNALKTIVSRLLSPTDRAAKLLGELGLNIDKVTWVGASASQRIEILAKKFHGLKDSQKAVVSETLASRFQINKFNILMGDVYKSLDAATRGQSRYGTAIDSSADKQKNFERATKELNTVLDSNPQKLKIIWSTLQNGMATAIQPLIPYLIAAAEYLKRLFTWFSNLPGGVQKFVLALLAVVALLGPVLRYVGSLITLVQYLATGFIFLGGAIWTAVSALASLTVVPAAKALGYLWTVMLKVLGPAVIVAWKVGASVITSIATALWGVLGKIWVAGSARLAALWVAGLARMKMLTLAAAAPLGAAMSFAVNAMTSAAAIAANGLRALWGSLMYWFYGSKVYGAIIAGSARISSAWNTMLVVLKGATVAFGFTISTVWNSIMSAIGIALYGGSGKIKAAYSATLLWLRNATLRFGVIITPIWTAVMSAIGGAMVAASGFLSSTWAAVMRMITLVTANAGAWIAVAWTNAMTVVSAAMTRAGVFLRGIWMATMAQVAAITRALPMMLRGAMITLTVFMSLSGKLAAGAFRNAWVLGMAKIRNIFPAILRMFATMSAAIWSVMTGPWGLAIGAGIAIVVIFRDQIWQLIKNTVGVFNLLPEGVRNAMQRVVDVVWSAAKQVYELFSFLNPWAHHSPSLVENVTTGMAEVNKQFGTLDQISGPIKKAYSDIKAFGVATAFLAKGLDSAQRVQDRIKLGKVAPGALDEFDALVADIQVLTGKLEGLSAKVDKQSLVVDKWKSRLDAANVALDAQKDKLDKLQDVADKAADSLEASKAKLEDFASAPIQGMKAMNDAIFANDMAQKKLRLEMMKMGEDGSIDDARDKIAKLAGEIDLLRGEQAGLRAGGAGSEILSQYDSQIAALEAQQGVTRDTVTEYDNMSKALDELQRKSEMLDLEKSLKFDPLLKKIDETAHAVKELPFDEIMTGINGANVEISKYSGEVDRANAAVAAQKAIVDSMTAARDALLSSYDAENAKLTTITDNYNKVKDAIAAANQALTDMNQSASSILTAASKNKSIIPKVASDMPDVGGTGGSLREGGTADQSKMIEQWAKDQAKLSGDLLSGFDMFKPIREQWNKFTAWLGNAWDVFVDGVHWPSIFDNFSSKWDKVEAGFKKVTDFLSSIWNLFKDDFKKIWDEIVAALKPAFDKLAPKLEKFKELVGPLKELFGKLWTILKPIAMFIGGVLLLAFKVIASVIANTVGPAIDWIIGIIGALIDIIRETIKFVVAIFNGDWKAAWEAFLGIFKGIWDLVVASIKGMAETIWGVVKGLVEGVVGFFTWLWDVLVGHSIVPDMVKAIIKWFTSLPGKVWEGLKSLGSKIIQIVKDAWNAWVNMNAVMWPAIWNFLSSLPGKAWDAIKGIVTKLALVAYNAFTAFKEKAEVVWIVIKRWIGEKVNDFIAGFTLIKDKIVQVGKDVMQGLVDGISAGYQWVKDKVVGVAEIIPEWLQKTLGIASPSKVTDKIGQQSGQGLANGVTKTVGLVKKAVSYVSDALTSGLSSDVKIGVNTSSTDGMSTEANNAWAAADKAFNDGVATSIDSFFQVGIPQNFDDTLAKSNDTWDLAAQGFSEKVEVPLKDFYSVTLPSLLAVIKNLNNLMWVAIRASFNANAKVPMTQFFGIQLPNTLRSTQQTASDMWKTVKTAFFVNFANPMTAFFAETIPQAIRGAFSGIGTAFRGAFSTAEGTAVAATNRVIGAINKGIGAINAVIPEVKFDIKAIKPIALAVGGPVKGAGTGVSDSIPAMLSNGEHVWTAREVAAVGGHGAMNEMRKMAVQGFAKGGEVTAGHAVGGQAGLIAFGKFLKSRGFDVTEGPAPFGPVHRVHSPNSLHYSDRAIDVNKGAGTSAQEQSYIDDIVKYAKEYGLRTIWRVKDHFNHAHFDTGRGDMLGGGAGAGIVDAVNQGKQAIAKSVAASLKTTNNVGDYIGKIGGSGLTNMGEYLKSKADSIWTSYNGTGDWDQRPGDPTGSRVIAETAELMARKLGATNKQILALIETGYVESGMRNLGGGDRDSLGFLQQRPSQGWGTPAEIMDVNHATKMFIAKAKRVDRASFTAGQLAQAVQISAYPDRYDKRRMDALATINRSAPGIPTNVYDNGGLMQSGTGGINLSGKPELVLDPQQTKWFMDMMARASDLSSAMSSGAVAGLKSPSMARLEAQMAQTEARANRADSVRSTVTYNSHTETHTVNINGDLSFPNIKTSSDAEGLVRNLSILAGGQ